jgi:hypothetical protein
MEPNMSCRKIKDPTKVKKTKLPEIGMKEALYSHLFTTRQQREHEEEEAVAKLIQDGQLDLLKVKDYDYMSKIAKGLDWSIGRLLKTVNRMTIILPEQHTEGEEDAKG